MIGSTKRRLEIQVRRSEDKVSDFTKDSNFRFRHLFIVYDSSGEDQCKVFFERKKSIVFTVIFDFLQSRQGHQKLNKEQIKNINIAFKMLQTLIRFFPYLFQSRWQSNAMFHLLSSFYSLHSKPRSLYLVLAMTWYNAISSVCTDVELELMCSLLPRINNSKVQHPVLQIVDRKLSKDTEINEQLKALLSAITVAVIELGWQSEELFERQCKSLHFFIRYLRDHYVPFIFSNGYEPNDVLFHKQDFHLYNITKSFAARSPYSDPALTPMVACRAVFIRWLCRFLHSCSSDKTLAETTVDLNCSYCPKSAGEVQLQGISQTVLLQDRTNICFLLEIFKQACQLPFHHSGTIMLALKICGQWLHRSIDSPLVSPKCWSTHSVRHCILLYIIYTSDMFKRLPDPNHYDDHLQCCSMVLKSFEFNIACKEQQCVLIWIHLLETMFINVRQLFDGNHASEGLLRAVVGGVLKLLCRSLAYQISLPDSIWTSATDLLCSLSGSDSVIKAWTHIVDCLTTIMADKVYQVSLRADVSNSAASQNKGAVSFRSAQTRTVTLTLPSDLTEIKDSNGNTTSSVLKKHIRSRSYSDSIAHLFYEDHKIYDVSSQSLQLKQSDSGQLEDSTALTTKDNDARSSTANSRDADIVTEIKLDGSSSCGDDVQDLLGAMSEPSSEDDNDSISNSFFSKEEDAKYEAECGDDCANRIDYENSSAVVQAWRNIIRCVGRPAQISSEESRLKVIRKQMEIWKVFCTINEELMKRSLSNNDPAITGVHHLYFFFMDFVELVKAKHDSSRECTLATYQFLCQSAIYMRQMFLPETYKDIITIILFYALDQEADEDTVTKIFEVCKTDILCIKGANLIFGRILQCCKSICTKGSNQSKTNAILILCSMAAFAHIRPQFNVLVPPGSGCCTPFAVTALTSSDIQDTIISSLTQVLNRQTTESVCCVAMSALVIVSTLLQQSQGNSDCTKDIVSALLNYLVESRSISASKHLLENLDVLMLNLCSAGQTHLVVLISQTILDFLRVQIQKYIDSLVHRRKCLYVTGILILCKWIYHVQFYSVKLGTEITKVITNSVSTVFKDLYILTESRNTSSHSDEIMKSLEYASTFLACANTYLQFQSSWIRDEDEKHQTHFAIRNNVILSFCDHKGNACSLTFRHVGGKFTWIVSPADDDLNSRLPEQHEQLLNLQEDRADAKISGEMRKPSNYHTLNVNPPLPVKGSDFLDELLRFITVNCSECLVGGASLDRARSVSAGRGGFDPVKLQAIRKDVDAFQEKFRESSNRIRPTHEQISDEGIVGNSSTAARLLYALGIFDLKLSGHLSRLDGESQLLRELRHLDTSLTCRETHKIAVIHVGPEDLTKTDILSPKQQLSSEYTCFIEELGEKVDLFSHQYFSGGLQRPSGPGISFSCYFCEPMTEIMFHVSTMMDEIGHGEENVLKKIKHIGNDEVQIVWSEAICPYNRSIIPTEFATTLIVIEPLQNYDGLFQIHIDCELKDSSFPSLIDGCIVHSSNLALLVRHTALNASRACRSNLKTFKPFYEERANYIDRVIKERSVEEPFDRFVTNTCQSTCLTQSEESR